MKFPLPDRYHSLGALYLDVPDRVFVEDASQDSVLTLLDRSGIKNEHPNPRRWNFMPSTIGQKVYDLDLCIFDHVPSAEEPRAQFLEKRFDGHALPFLMRLPTLPLKMRYICVLPPEQRVDFQDGRGPRTPIFDNTGSHFFLGFHPMRDAYPADAIYLAFRVR